MRRRSQIIKMMLFAKKMKLVLLISVGFSIFLALSVYDVTGWRSRSDSRTGYQFIRPSNSISYDSPSKTILLVTYPRSGSTFTSYILQGAPDTFFFFEPLRPLLFRTTAGMDIILNYAAIGGDYLKPQELPVSNLSSYEHRALDVLQAIVTCDISKYPVGDYDSSHFYAHGNVATLRRCLLPMKRNVSEGNLSRYLQCLLVFFQSCHRAPLRVFKLVRLPVRSLFPILRQHPDVRVVYLVRDPRAILFSQRALFGHAPKAEDFCNMVVDDVSHMQLLQQKFPGRAVAVRYEDISRNPLEAARRLYEALGLEMTSHVVTSVVRMTSASRKQEGSYTTYRANPVKTAEKWRSSVEFYEVNRSDAVCGRAYERLLGYRTASEESVLRNLNISLMGPPGELSVI